MSDPERGTAQADVGEVERGPRLVCPLCHVHLPSSCTPAGLSSHQRGKACIRRVSKNLRLKRAIAKRRQSASHQGFYESADVVAVEPFAEPPMDDIHNRTDYTRMMLTEYSTPSPASSQQEVLGSRIADLIKLASELDTRRVRLVNEEGEEVAEVDLASPPTSKIRDAGRRQGCSEAEDDISRLVSAVANIITPTSGAAGLSASSRPALFEVVDLALFVGHYVAASNPDSLEAPKISDLMQQVSGRLEKRWRRSGPRL